MICLGALPTVVAFLNTGRGSDGRPWSSSAASSTATVLMRFMDFRCARRDSKNFCCDSSSKLPLLKEVGHAQAPRGAAPTITAVIAAQVGGREVRRRCRGPKEGSAREKFRRCPEGVRAAIAGWRGERAGRGVVAPSDGLLPRAATVGRRPGGQKPGDDGALDGA